MIDTQHCKHSRKKLGAANNDQRIRSERAKTRVSEDRLLVVEYRRLAGDLLEQDGPRPAEERRAESTSPQLASPPPHHHYHCRSSSSCCCRRFRAYSVYFAAPPPPPDHHTQGRHTASYSSTSQTTSSLLAVSKRLAWIPSLAGWRGQEHRGDGGA